MALDDGSTATVSGTSYTSCSALVVSGCTWGPPTAICILILLVVFVITIGLHLNLTNFHHPT